MSSELDRLPVLILSPHARCNCRCTMCDIWQATDESCLNARQLERLLPDIEKLAVQWVLLSGGEPLMHPELFEICKPLRARGIRITMLSTGLLLARHAESICNYVNDVIVSLDGPPELHDKIRRVGGAFASLQNGIGAIHAIRPSFSVSARCTVQRINHASLVETAEWGYGLGLRSLSFLAADVTSEAFNRATLWPTFKQDRIALSEDQIEVLADQFVQIESRWSGTGFVLENREKLQRIVRHFRAHIGLAKPEAPRCNAPWVSAVIEADGTIRPCFFHRPIGSISQSSLLQVLNGSLGLAFRNSLEIAANPTCQNCVCSLNWKDGSGSQNAQRNLGLAAK